MDNEFIRQYCTSLPAVTEDVKWDHDLVFSVGGKMFLVTALDGPFKCSFKVKDEEFEELSVQPGIIPAPYMARAKWIQITSGSRWSKNDLKKYIDQSYELVKAKLTKKLRQEIGI